MVDGAGVAAGSAKDRAGRGREDDKSDELEIFERRHEWFQLYHTDKSGWTSEARIEQAVRHAVRLEELPPPWMQAPGGTAPSEPLVALVGLGDVDGEGPTSSIRAADNPAPESSLGFASDTVQVDFDEAALPLGVDVQVPLTPESIRNVDVVTVRMFRFDDEVGSWVLVPRSGVSQDGTYGWVRAHRPGLYVAAGLPLNPALANAVVALQALEPHIEAAARRDDTNVVSEALTNLLFAGGAPRDYGGFDAAPGEGPDIEELTSRITSLDLARQRLLEWQILDDLARASVIAPAPPSGALARLAAAGWVAIGPNNVNGRIKSIAVHPTDANTVWVGAANGGVWKTTNGGTSWSAQWSRQLSLAVGAISVAPSNPSVLYAATGEDTPGWGPSWPGVGVYRSTDGGNTWKLLTAIASNRCTKVLIHPTNPDIVYVAGNSGLHKTTDGGTSWTNVRTDHVSDALMDPTNPNRLFAGVWNSGVYRSTDGGVTWTLLSSGIPTGAAADWIKLTMGRNGTNGTNFLLAKMAIDSGTIYRSTNGGTTWAQLATNVEPASYNEWTNMIGVDPNNHNNIIAGGIGLSRSTNGSTFAAVGGTHSDHHQVVWSPSSPGTLYLATDGGVYKSTNGGAAWTLASSGLVATQLYSIGVSQGASFRVGGATQDQGIIQTTAPPNWVDTGAGNEGGIFVVDPNTDQVIYVTPWSSNLRRSTNGGASWTTIAPPVTVNDLAVRFDNSNQLLCVGGSQIFASTNKGTNWSSVATVTGSALRVVYSPSSPNTCYATTNAGRVYRSTTGGGSGSWAEPYAAADKPPNGTIAAIAVSHTNPNRLFIGYAGFGVAHVWRSTDGGAHWTNAAGTGTSTLPDIPVNALVIHHLNPDVVYAATDIGVFRTGDGGLTWKTFNLGLPRAFMSGLVLRKTNKTLYASTMGRGAFSRSVSSP